MNEIIIYESSENKVQVEVEFDGDTVWLSLNQLTMLFDRDKSVISRHLNNIFKAGELEKDSVVAKYATTASDGKIYQVDYYNLDVIISVGYPYTLKEEPNSVFGQNIFYKKIWLKDMPLMKAV